MTLNNYNGDGERTRLTTYAQRVPYTTTYTVADTRLLAATVNTQTTLYVAGKETTLAEYQTSMSYPLRDGTGSVRQVTDSSQTVTLARTYKPFDGLLQEQAGMRPLSVF